MNTIAATTRRAPRTALIGLAVLIAAFAALMLVRTGVLSGSSSEPAQVVAVPHSASVPSPPAKTTPTKPRVVLLPGLPTQVARRLLYSRVIVVSLYANPSDRATTSSARAGARRAGAGFTAISLTDEANARAVAAFAGSASSPTVLVVRRPGKIVNRLPGSADASVVAQAAHNAGARR